MKINNITPVSFGYSKKSQDYLYKNLQTVEDKQLGQYLLDYSNFCNETEELIKANEKKYGPSYSKNSVVDMFLTMKEDLTTQVMILFDDSDKYLESEYDYYSKSLGRCKEKKDNWRQFLMDKLRFWDTSLGKTSEELKIELEDAKKYKEVARMQLGDALRVYGPALGYNIQQPTTAKKQETEESPIAKMEKTEYSPNGFADIMGMEDLKKELKESIVDAVNNPEQAKLDFEEYGKKMPAGVLLYGPPGCGKTYIIEALASEIDTPVYVLDIGEQGSKYINQTSNNIKSSFDYVVEQAEKQEKPVILFMDEMDSMTFNRDSGTNEENIKQVATLLKCIEQAKAHNVIVIGATNKYDLIDPAIRRRFDMKRYVGLPNQDQRKQQVVNNLSKKTKGQILIKDNDSLNRIANALDGYSYHSINTISNAAALNALDRGRADIALRDFEKAIKETAEEKIEENVYKTKEAKKTSIGFACSEF